MELNFKTERISPCLTRIFCFNSELVYLAEGSQGAALLDTGSGFGSLKACVDALTDKPLTVLCTHGHTDHALGAAEFAQVYLSPLDASVYARHSAMPFRAESGGMWPEFDQLRADQIVPAAPFSAFLPLHAGDVFDLGGLHIEALPCPGHTPGSMVLLLREARTLLLGDACNPCTFLFDDFTASVEDYREMLLRLKAATDGRYDRVLISHGDGEGAPDMIESVIAVCDDILSGCSDEEDFVFLGTHATLAKAVGADGRRLDGGSGNLVYDKRHVRSAG